MDHLPLLPTRRRSPGLLYPRRSRMLVDTKQFARDVPLRRRTTLSAKVHWCMRAKTPGTLSKCLQSVVRSRTTRTRRGESSFRNRVPRRSCQADGLQTRTPPLLPPFALHHPPSHLHRPATRINLRCMIAFPSQCRTRYPLSPLRSHFLLGRKTELDATPSQFGCRHLYPVHHLHILHHRTHHLIVLCPVRLPPVPRT